MSDILDNADEPKVNRFLDIFPLEGLVFKAVTDGGQPLTFEKGREKGTKQVRLAEVSVELGHTGAYLEGAYVVRRVRPSGENLFLMQWGSKAGNNFAKVINAKEDENAERDLAAYGDMVVDHWRAYQKRRKEEGTTTTKPILRSGIQIGQDELDALGLGAI